MKKILSIIIVAAALAAVTACGNRGTKNNSEENSQVDSLMQALDQSSVMKELDTLPEEPVFDIVTTMGTIRVRLYADTPLHRDNFAKLAMSGYYRNVLFHRVIKNFMIQTGEPLTKDKANVEKYGTGGPDYQIPAEILPNHHHKKGALAAARKSDIANPLRESSGSQFYIVQSEQGCSHLDGAYTIFGETIDGFDVIDKIASVETGPRDLPKSAIRIANVKLVKDIE